MSLMKSVTTKYEIDGREFVDVDDFLACYPNATEKAKTRIKRRLKTFNGDVEKRIEEPLVERLINTCWPVKYPDTALYAPIVLRDGWVIWVSKGHEPLIDALGELFVKRDAPDRDIHKMLAQLSGDIPSEPHQPNIDLLTGGYAWYISTVDPRTTVLGKAYKEVPGDRDIFKTFIRRYID